MNDSHSASCYRLGMRLQKRNFEELRPAVKLATEGLPGTEGKSVAVLGDIGLDEYLIGPVKRISPEAPVPVLEVESEEFRSGLAANVAQNLVALGGKAPLIGLVGQDAAADQLSVLLKNQGVADLHFVTENERPTTRKVRVMSGQHHLVRVDFEKRQYVHENSARMLAQKLETVLQWADGLVLQDYGKGVLSEALCQDAIAMAKAKGKRVLVDPHRTTPVHFYRGADLIKPNRDEAFVLSGLNIDDLRQTEDSILRVAQAIFEKTKVPYLTITQGQDGVLVFEGDKVTHVPTRSRQVFDVTGAGDTFLAAFSLAWLSGYSLEAAAVTANAASGVVVGKVGSVPCSREELKKALDAYFS